jgi:succinate dehydrogenase flavin-adding protein (antitoxin of CptAB toxin-antitoxin module)
MLRIFLAALSDAQERGLARLLPTRDAALFRWCLTEGFRAIKPMSLMVIGEY